jgi:hypothetical protein
MINAWCLLWDWLGRQTTPDSLCDRVVIYLTEKLTPVDY